MQCRHTLPDWHRYVESGEDAPPILAGCRLLVREGERVRDPRSIACAYWGRQRECPLYDGPGARPSAPAGPATRAPSADVPVAAETVWPVRAPTAPDGMRRVLVGLGALSAVLLAWAAGQALADSGGGLPVTLAAAGILGVTLLLAGLRAWARR